MTLIAGVAPERIETVKAKADAAYRAARPITEAHLASGATHYLEGVPMHWVTDWRQPFPMLVAGAKGATLRDVDGNQLDDFCLGDTGSMFLGFMVAGLSLVGGYPYSRGALSILLLPVLLLLLLGLLR